MTPSPCNDTGYSRCFSTITRKFLKFLPQLNVGRALPAMNVWSQLNIPILNVRVYPGWSGAANVPVISRHDFPLERWFPLAFKPRA